VLHLEHGDWKIVNWHSSIPAANEDYGFLLTKSVDEIAEAVSESRPDLTESSAPDGTVTIAFTDIEDSLRLNAFLGDRRWLDVLRAHNQVVIRTTEEYAGTVVKSQGRDSCWAPRGRDGARGRRSLRSRGQLRGTGSVRRRRR
jgi:class 3 adenylate cyclase